MDRKGQNTVEYILILTIVIIVVLLAVTPGGFFNKRTDQSLNVMVKKGVGCLYTTICYDPKGCPPVIGDGCCEPGEPLSSIDCGNCVDSGGRCTPGSVCCTGLICQDMGGSLGKECLPLASVTCGNGVCNGICAGGGENCTNCPQDCGPCGPGPVCGDHTCNGGVENCSNCPADCGSCCLQEGAVCKDSGNIVGQCCPGFGCPNRLGTDHEVCVPESQLPQCPGNGCETALGESCLSCPLD